MSTGSLSNEEFDDYNQTEQDYLNNLDNTDYQDLVQRRLNDIDQIQQADKLLSDPFKIIDLTPNYENSPDTIIIKKKLKYLVENNSDPNGKFSHINKSRGDGNCFYRCFAFGLIRFLIERCGKDERIEIRSRMKTAFDELTQPPFNYPDFTTLDIWENFEDILDVIESKLENRLNLPENILASILNEYFNEAAYDNYIVSNMRFLTSYGLQLNKGMDPGDSYTNYIAIDQSNFINMRLYCNNNIECMGQDADAIQIRALSHVIGLSTKVCYVDLSKPDGYNVDQELVRPDFHKFNEEVVQEGGQFHINLLYRPGHYDLLIL